MNVEHMSELAAAIGRSEERFPGTSCLLTGSAAREELRVFQNSVQSDIDLLLVVHDEQSALNCREVLKELLQEVTREFTVDLACTITLRDHIVLRRDAGFVRSAAAAPPIWDHMGIADALRTLRDDPPPQTSGALGQPVSYYCAKARGTGNSSDWDKARTAIETLSQFLSYQSSASAECQIDQDQEDVTQSAVSALAASTDLWPSSVYFLASVGKVSDADLQYGVRDRVFLENHGLEFETAFVRG